MANTTPIAPYISPDDKDLFDQAKALGFVYDPKRPYYENKGYAQYAVGQSQLPDNHKPFKDSLFGQGLTALGNALQRHGFTDTAVNPPSSADAQALSRLLDPIIQEHGIPSVSSAVTRQAPQASSRIMPQREYPGINTPLPPKETTNPGINTPLPQQETTTPAYQPSADHMARALGVRALTDVAYNPTTNYGGHPVYMTANGIYGVPQNSIGGLESYAHLMGTTPTQLVKQEDLLKARGMQESPYWQQQYGDTLRKTQNPYLARADANLAATEASKNAYGVFDRVLADPTMKASVLGNNQINGQLYLDSDAGNVNRGLLSTTPQAYGSGTEGHTLIRLPNGSVVAARISANMPPMLTATGIGADAAYKQDMTYAQQMAALEALRAKAAGNPALANDPLYHLKIMKMLMEINKAQLELNHGGKSQSIKLPQVPFEQVPSEMQQQILEKLQNEYGLGGNDPNKVGLG
ncbi:hypothetical protein [Xenorhabdus innexi]|uniref:Uncharacterized protein n=1 Tax=Xenorhabdus innexi TaxID=290109 RepID=A0A1N6MWJ9_9GAMM|nr:hypothetical protein [Xenorhabdus innexi]PHM35917.1 hypothetical protein Xinn_01987 [Xenorhabdus innexi]SIP73216.1 hypothetical protein XIS1_1790022 [Xenorhabdus innexi]